jgi:chemotaxis protein MotB
MLTSKWVPRGQGKNSMRRPINAQEDAGEFASVYGDMITFVASFFILLFILTYNSKQEQDFLTQLQLKLGSEATNQERTTEALFVSQLQGFIKKEKLEDSAKVLVDEQKIKLVMSTPVLFDSGNASLRPEGRKILDGFAPIFKGTSNPIIVEGHTDNVPIKTVEFASNWELSFKRAFSVMQFFMGVFDFKPTQLTGVGYGEYHPIVPNVSDENRAKNRRIELSVIRITAASGK